jgi:ABC-type uncharacterized transport system auxiliary subunit
MNVASLWNRWKGSSRAFAPAVLGVCAAAFTVACGGVPRDYFYTLQPPAVAPATGKTTYVLGIEPFRSPAILRDDRIVYYSSPTALDYYRHHRWGAIPAELVGEFAAQWLQEEGAFAQVKMFPVRGAVDYILGGEVTRFEEVDSGDSVKVRLAVALSLVRRRDQKLVWSGEQREEMPVQGQGVAAVASTLSAACTQALGQMLPGLVAQVEQAYSSSGK